MLDRAYQKVCISVRQGGSEKIEMNEKGWLGVRRDEQNRKQMKWSIWKIYEKEQGGVKAEETKSENYI